MQYVRDVRESKRRGYVLGTLVFVDSVVLFRVLDARNSRKIRISYIYVFSSYMLICVAQRENIDAVPPTPKGCDGFQHPCTLWRTLAVKTNG